MDLVRTVSRSMAEPYQLCDLVCIPLHKADLEDFATDDINKAKSWSTARRWHITIATVVLVVNASFASSSPSGCIPSIHEDLHVSEEAAGLTVTLFLLGYCAGPLIFAPLSEFYGRRWVLYSTFSLYVLFNLLCAFAPNFAILLAGRFLTGTFAGAPLSIAPGVIADIWEPRARGNAMGVFVTMTFTGPVLAPVVSGYLQLEENWRWSFYVLLWMGGASCILMLTIPETHPAAISRNRAGRVRTSLGSEDVNIADGTPDRKLLSILKLALIRPWLILFNPIAFFIAIYLSVVYACLYMLFTIYPFVFQQNRHWNSSLAELPLLGTAIGAIIGGGINFLVSAYANSNPDKRRAEDRLPLAMAGGLLLPISVFWFSWTANFDIHWVIPTLAGVFVGLSLFLILSACLNYLTDTYLIYTASAMAGNQICRSACAAAAPLYTGIMFDKLGVGVAGSVVGGVTAVLAPIPFVFYLYGERVRGRSKFTPTLLPKKPVGDEEQTSVQDEEQQPVEDEALKRAGDDDREAKEQSEEPYNSSRTTSTTMVEETLQKNDSS